MEEALNNLIETLKTTEEYINYRKSYSAIEDDQEALNCVEGVRELNVRVAKMTEEEYNAESENIDRKMGELIVNPRVVDFIEAELDFSRLYQHITECIIDTLEEE